ncbi:MAG: response regulator [Gemmatimonadetes bacterium]|nr:response regulator [Gemmatimonadota bacterium]
MNDEAVAVPRSMIMVVEDEQPVRELMERALRAGGHSVIALASGDEALVAAEQHPVIHLLITDIVMRGINGRELAARLQQSRPDLRVLYVSGYTQRQTGLDADPAAPFLEKPFALEDLVARANRLLAR